MDTFITTEHATFATTRIEAPFTQSGSIAASVAIYGSRLTQFAAANVALWIEVQQRVEACWR